jgi:hypothetical protein
MPQIVDQTHAIADPQQARRFVDAGTRHCLAAASAA